MHHIIIQATMLEKSKYHKKFKVVTNALDKAKVDYIVHKTTRHGEAGEITKEITKGCGNVIIAMCGDGTLHDILNGFVNFTDNALSLIPLGTGNDFAASAKIPYNPKKAIKIILYRKPRPIDFIQFSSGLRSINAVGMGIDVDVLKRVYSRNDTGKSKYLRSLIYCLQRFKSYDFTAVYDDGTQETHCGLIAAVGNGKQFGGGIKVCPKAKIDDGLLDVMITDYISHKAIPFAFIRLMLGKVNTIKQVILKRVKCVKFIPKENYAIQADGELYENTVIDIKVSGQKLLFYM